MSCRCETKWVSLKLNFFGTGSRVACLILRGPLGHYRRGLVVQWLELTGQLCQWALSPLANGMACRAGG